MKQAKIFFYVLALLITINAATALDIQPLGNTNDTGVYRVDDDTMLYRDGNTFYYADAQGVQATITESSSCTAAAIFDSLVPAEDEDEDLYSYCDLEGKVYKLDYTAGTFTAMIGNFSNVTASEEALVGVTDRYYWFSSYVGGGATLAVYHRTNGTLRMSQLCNTGTWQPICGTPATIYERNGRPYYPGSTATMDRIYYPVYFIFGGSRKVYNAFIGANITGTPTGVYSTSAFRPYYWYSAYSIWGQPPTNMRSSENYYVYDEYTGADNLGCYDSDGVVYCHNGQSSAGAFVPNRFEMTVSNGYSQAFSNSLTLPNGTAVTVRDVKRSGENVLVVYNDLSTELYVNNGLSIPKGTLTASKDSYHEYLMVYDDFLTYCETDGDCFVVTDFNTFSNPPAIEVFARIGAVITDDGLRNTTTEYSIPDDNKAVFYNSATSEILYDELPPFPNATGPGWGQPYIELLTGDSVYTEYPDVEIIVRSYDITNSTPYLAQRCAAGAIDTDRLIASNGYADYTDALYQSTCVGTKRPSTSILFDDTGVSIPAGYYVDYDSDACAENLREVLTGTLVSEVSYAQSFLLGDNNGIELSFRNVYDQEVSRILVRADQIAGGFAYGDPFIYVDGAEVFTESTAYALGPHYNGKELVIIANFHDSVVDYTVWDGERRLWQGSGSQNYPTPIQSVVRTTQPSTTGGDTFVGVGPWVLYEGSADPDYSMTSIDYLGYLDGYQYFKLEDCDYTAAEGLGSNTLQVFVSRTGVFGNEYDKTERWIAYDDAYLQYLEQVESGIIPDATAVENQQAGLAATVDSIGLHTSSDRFLFAFITVIVLTMLAALFMHNQYENTLASQLLPLAVYAGLFIFFAAIGFFPVWFVALNVIIVGGGIALLVSGGRNG